MATKILLIGGDSFIAQKFIEHSKNDFQIFSISRRRTRNVQEKILNDFFQISDDDFNKVDVVINFAAIVHRNDNVKEETYRKINYQLPMFLAEKSAQNHVKHYIQISTVSVYGRANKISINTPYSPLNNYAKYKLMTDEELSKKYHNHSMNLTILRPSMIYGGGRAPGNLSRLIKLVKMGIPLPFKGFNKKRHFLNIHHMTYALSQIVKNKITGKHIIADIDGVSTSRLISIINNELGKKDKQFTFRLFWFLVGLVNKGLINKLNSELLITNTLDLSTDRSHTIETGIKEMIQIDL